MVKLVGVTLEAVLSWDSGEDETGEYNPCRNSSTFVSRNFTVYALDIHNKTYFKKKKRGFSSWARQNVQAAGITGDYRDRTPGAAGPGTARDDESKPSNRLWTAVTIKAHFWNTLHSGRGLRRRASGPCPSAQKRSPALRQEDAAQTFARFAAKKFSSDLDTICHFLGRFSVSACVTRGFRTRRARMKVEGRRITCLLLSFAVICLVATPGGRACPRRCACYVPSEVHCTFRYLTSIPDGIPPNVERINLGYNSLVRLKETDFSGLNRLELLMLHSNSIHTVPDRTFSDLQALQVRPVEGR
ncbi:PREDICTED: uncharacterized protein LOC103610409 [Galeopterus variegatus]|uniref:Uncharacterized protein LOC103610409 n=1 Tax=Galeopterus variegatus TaxID=482537 RepID=A0ABM0SIW8_GALVR|nr:PREDICTED: uncharacterized protein LOC103610409 [Galeopterus variegatus]